MSYYFKILIFLVVTPLGKLAYGQTSIDTRESEEPIKFYSGSIYHDREKVENIDGTIFINEEWQKGSIYYDIDQQSEIENMKYDAFDHQIVFLKERKAYRLNEQVEILSFSMGNQKFEKHYLEDMDLTDFLEVLYEDSKTRLLKRYKCTFFKGKPSTGALPGRNDRYEMKTELYIMRDTDKLIKLKQNKSGILAALEDNSDEILEYAKAERLNFKKEQDLVALIKFYDSL